MLDLVALVPDNAIEQAIRGMLSSPQKLRTRPIAFRVDKHPGRDPGCFETGPELLEPFARQARHGLIVLDMAWEGAPHPDAADIERDVQSRLAAAWQDRGCCVVIDPEVEVWLWTDSPHLLRELEWSGTTDELRAWLAERNLWPSGAAKPPDPKRAFQEVAQRTRIPAGSEIFRELARSVSYQRCTDRAFRRLLATLTEWFPPTDDPPGKIERRRGTSPM